MVMIPVVQVTWQLDLVDDYRRLLGDDPHRDEKARFLAATSELRVGLAAKARIARARGSRDETRRQLETLWSDGTRPASERKRAICALWAELDTSSEGGAASAAVIESFVRARLGPTSPHRFSDEELASCPRGSTGRPFTPHP